MSSESLFGVFVFSFIVSFGAVVSPGPVSAAIVSEGPRLGWKVGPLVACGHTFLELLMVVILSLSLSAGMTTPGVITAISLVGGLVLIWIGVSYLYGVWKGNIHLPQALSDTPDRSPLSLVVLGALTTISNPFWYTWWVTVAASYLAQARAISIVAILVFYLGHISADFAWDTALAAATTASRRWLTDSGYKVLITITGGFMFYLGIVYLKNAIF